MGNYTPSPWGCSIYKTYLEFFCIGDLSLHPIYYLFSHLFILLYMDSCMDIYVIFGLWSNALLFILLLKLWHTWPLDAHSVGFCVPLLYPHHCEILFCFCFLNASSYSGTTKYSMLFLYILCPSHRIRHFSKEPLFLLLESRIRNQNLVVRSAHCY